MPGTREDLRAREKDSGRAEGGGRGYFAFRTSSLVLTCGVWPIFCNSSMTESTRPGRTRSTRSVSRPTTSRESFLRAKSSSASTASSVCTRQTRRWIFTGMRPPAAGRAGSIDMPLPRQRGPFAFGHDLRAVGDLVTVALLGQKQLPVVREVLLAGVAGHQRVEVRY